MKKKHFQFTANHDRHGKGEKTTLSGQQWTKAKGRNKINVCQLHDPKKNTKHKALVLNSLQALIPLLEGQVSTL